jgi:uncharacterized membrane protein
VRYNLDVKRRLLNWAVFVFSIACAICLFVILVLYVVEGIPALGSEIAQLHSERNRWLLMLGSFALLAITAAVLRHLLIENTNTWKFDGLCPKCGYDLRATPDRCPECGTIPPNKETVSN